MTKRIFPCLFCIVLSLPTIGCKKATKPEAPSLSVKEVGFPSAADALAEYCLRKIRSDKRPNLEVYIGGNAPPPELKRLMTSIEKANLKVSSMPPVSKNGTPNSITFLVQGFSVTEQSVIVALNTIFGPRNGSEESLVFRQREDGWVLESARETAVY